MILPILYLLVTVSSVIWIAVIIYNDIRKAQGKYPLHRHIYVFSAAFTVPHYSCTECGKISFRPWWPLWKEYR